MDVVSKVPQLSNFTAHLTVECMVRECKEDATNFQEPIYVVKVDKYPFEENVVVCSSWLCQNHAGLLSWSI